jgi:hypothetical protein
MFDHLEVKVPPPHYRGFFQKYVVTTIDKLGKILQKNNIGGAAEVKGLLL